MSSSADICEFPALMSQSCMQQVYDWVEFFSGEGKVSAEMRKAGDSLEIGIYSMEIPSS